jgi:DNA helicase II / ATP-dependent DNA helicase PcrA
MPAQNHPDYKEEIERLDYTLGYVDKSLNQTLERKTNVDRDVSRSRMGLIEDNSSAYIELMINSMFQDNVQLRLKNLHTSKSKPYFSRIDFKENDKDSAEKIYIGKMSLMRDEDQELVIVDWRAPVANLYYEGRLGETGYKCPDGNIEGELYLKRQFTINDGKLEEIFDIDITTSDEFLQSYLGASADNRLKDIVSTIQTEQNRIIRADMWKPLIVQGAAGSGKTTIALHRIAYLIYTFEKTFDPENFMIIATNKLFLNYISEVLPELGVDRVKQTTFEDFAMTLIGKKFKIKDSNEKLTSFVNQNASEDEIKRNELIKKESELKSSMLFKEIIDEYIKIIEKTFIPKEDFKIETVTLFKYEEINDLFINQYKDIPLVKRIDEIKKHLSNRLKLKKDSIIQGLQLQCDRIVKTLKMEMEENEERRQLIVEAIDNKNEMISKIQTNAKSAIKKYIDKISKINPYEYYKDLITNEILFGYLLSDKVEDELINFTREYTMENLKAGFIETEDLAPMIYLKYKIHGMDEKIPVKHIVIDEAQDFSVFQFYVLRKIVRDSSFTILGDLCQGIHSYRGTKDWEEVKKYAFEDERSEILTLEQSYRTTVEIMEAANKVIKKLNDESLTLAKPVIRHGEPVSVIKKDNLKEIAVEIDSKITEYKKNGFKSIAIICKTIDECMEIASYFKKSENKPGVITGKEKEYKSGVVIVPSYLAKGLEFDVVLISNAGAEEYSLDELDTKLLYVAMTRPLHKLNIYYHNELSPLLTDVV